MSVPTAAPTRARSLVAAISEELRARIEAGDYLPGDRLPSESQLTRAHSVSRTVVREAIAILRSDGLVEARKGAGVFALDPSHAKRNHPFSDLDSQRISEVIELLELRSAFEIRSAGLAAARRSPAQLEAILRAHEEVGRCLAEHRPTRDADFEFHFAIAEATQNRRFPEFLTLVRPGILPRTALGGEGNTDPAFAPNPVLQQEHGACVDAIVDGDPVAAETAMKVHLQGSLSRYRDLLRTSMSR